MFIRRGPPVTAIVVNADLTSAGAPALTLATGDTVTLQAGVSISTTGNKANNVGAEAMTSAGSGNHLTLLGEVSSAAGWAIGLGGGDQIDIGAAAHISGYFFGLYLGLRGIANNTTAIVNRGTISASSDFAIYSEHGAVNIVISETITSIWGAVIAKEGNNSLV